jgi:L-ascorbate metabolism protein UlaG (beta-lactamase superfamily)
MRKLFFFLFVFNFLNFNLEALEMDTFKTKSGKEIKITFIKHGSLMIEYDKKIIQLDPVSDYADYKKFQKADFVFITHEHGDHFDKKALKDSQKNTTKTILNQSTRDLLGNGEVMKNWDKITFSDDFTVEAVPAYNTSEGRTKYHPKGRDNGYIFDFDGFKIYVAGDTENIPEMSGFNNIDVAFLPVNQPYTMTIEQAVEAAKTLKTHILYPYHYGSTKVQKIVELLKDSNIDVRIREMQ